MSFDMNPADEDPHGECRHEIESLIGEIDQLRQFSRRQAEEIENLNGMADAVEVLRDIGKVFGCGHVDDPDGRRQLTNCIEQEFDRLRAALAKIAKWFGEFPPSGREWQPGEPMSYGAAFGSNGERDFMRQVAVDALNPVTDELK